MALSQKQLNSLTAAQHNAYDLMQMVLQQAGLGSLAGELFKLVKSGLQGDSLTFALSQTKAYQHRFAGNQQRIKNGLAPLSPAEYLATERAYRQIFQSAGVPAGFYDQHSDFAGLIGADLSPNEIQTRVQQATQFVRSTDPNVRAALQQYHGVGTGDIIAYYLDPKRATTLLQKTSDEATIGAAALDQGLSLTSLDRVDRFIDQGFNPSNAQQAYQEVGTVLPDTKKLGQIYGTDYKQSDAEDEFLGGLASAQRKRQKLAQQEQDAFSGGSGVGRDTFTQSSGSY